MTLVHGTCIEIDGVGVLLRGAPGSGKSDLGLRLIEAGGALVADDYVWLNQRDGDLFASAPDSIAGMIEVRGVGVLSLPHRAVAPLGLAIDLVPPGEVPRLPDPEWTEIDGVRIRAYRLAAFEPSAAVKVKLAARAARDAIIGP